MRACRQTFEAAIPPSCLVIADHLSARSLSVTSIDWNVINCECKKGVSGQHTTFTSSQNAAFSNEFFSALDGLDVIFAAYFILRGRDMHIDFLRLLFLVGVIWPLMQENSLRLKKLVN